MKKLDNSNKKLIKIRFRYVTYWKKKLCFRFLKKKLYYQVVLVILVKELR